MELEARLDKLASDQANIYRGPFTSDQVPNEEAIKDIAVIFKRWKRGVNALQLVEEKYPGMTTALMTSPHQSIIHQGIGIVPGLATCCGISIGSQSEEGKGFISQVHYGADDPLNEARLAQLIEVHAGRPFTLAAAGLNYPKNDLLVNGYGANLMPVTRNEWEDYLKSQGYKDFTLVLRQVTAINSLEYHTGIRYGNTIIHSTTDPDKPIIVTTRT